jgi:dGTPase
MTTTPLVDRASKEAREARELAPWARKSGASRGRRFPEGDDPLRTCWERDRDRVVHATAFRRLMYRSRCRETARPA